MREIILTKINHGALGMAEALGISYQEFNKEMFRIIRECPLSKDLSQKLGLTAQDIPERGKAGTKVSKVIVDIWEKKGRKSITLEEVVGTYMLICKQWKVNVGAIISIIPIVPFIPISNN